MADTTEIWVERLTKIEGPSPEGEVEEVVHEVYETAQKDLDAQRAEAEYEREE
ncbi:hypothetical protein [Streptomyces sp. DW26H14]|uniref:hypothetical protein n=1 Tax=Streptomyces sp. DW26H14 TaxID=3435395 RepID=UPI00403E0479